MTFKIKIKQDNQVIARQTGDTIEDFDNLFKDLKKKYKGLKQ